MYVVLGGRDVLGNWLNVQVIYDFKIFSQFGGLILLEMTIKVKTVCFKGFSWSLLNKPVILK